MRSVLWTGTCLLGFIASSGAIAATVQDVSGNVSLSRGYGYQAVRGTTTASPGDFVMAGQNGQAVIVYDDGCKVKVEPSSTVTVSPTSPCKLGLVDDPGVVFLSLAAVAGVGAAVVASSDHGPASP